MAFGATERADVSPFHWATLSTLNISSCGLLLRKLATTKLRPASMSAVACAAPARVLVTASLAQTEELLSGASGHLSSRSPEWLGSPSGPAFTMGGRGGGALYVG